MPLYKTIHPNSSTQILVWHITESFSDLVQDVILNENSRARLQSMKSQMQQRAFLSVRKVLQQAGYKDFDLYYDAFGKPHLQDGKYISITHSHEFSAVIISDQSAGIDMELQREKISRIANKFCNTEWEYLTPQNKGEYIQKLTVIWGVKEAVFKIKNQKGISFKNHIQVHPFELETKTALATLTTANFKQQFAIFFEPIDDFTLVYAFEK
ncbi:4'-phosphopantetheinyl transferase family protein [Flavobacterium restrictum]|uniref:4'-phosphopantetheinyl transferase superfamily protein n=1 Tax=Flavobacterium restrictum TaxID=2594428 RepID=A0A553E1N0_9FLAO|nr:4'-phosphopantetheinyl transferase superfamily protein [Flavobacterium restrictum]TRX38964.1 4'-phosphopantetheinyl transferase superfamily protein [Flavobacterium restrictum]